MAEPATAQSPPVGFIGLGVMGAPMAANLLAAGLEVVVHNRSSGPVQELVARGASAAATPAEVATRTETTITMLPDSPDVERVYRGESGLLGAIRSGQLLIDMSTIAPAVARSLAAEVAAKGATMLDAPVSGGDVAARGATLSIMVGGDPEAFRRANDVLSALGQTIVHVGPAGAGQVVKACNQVVVALSIQAVAEALVLGDKAGVAPEAILDVLGGGLAANRVMEVRRSNFLEHDFTPGFRLTLHAKDLRIALAEAHESGVVLPGAAMVNQLVEAACVAGHADSDHSALLTVVERLSEHVTGGTAAVQTAPEERLDR
jgi:2-hydroxy-3-oxopropionate reductase